MVSAKLTTVLALAATTGALALPAADPTLDARAPQFSIPSMGGFGGSSTSNDVTSGACKPYTYIFARGTTETGNMGTTVGPALAQKLQSALGADSVAVQGVNYPADFAGAVQGSISPKTAAGSTNCASLIKQAVAKCPDTQVVLAGYSQGAQQVHGCLMNLDEQEAGKVKAAVTFGDPLRAQPFQNIDAGRTKVFCATGDLVCTNQFIITAAHLSYATQSTGPAADFIKSKVDAQ